METTIVVPPRKRSFWKILLFCAGGFFALILLIAVMLLGTRRAWQFSETPDMQDNVLIAQLVSRVSNAMFTPEGSIARYATLELNPAELNAAIRTGLRNYRSKHHAPGDPVVNALWQNGALNAEISLPVAGEIALNIQVALVPHLEKENLVLSVRQLRAGWIPLPTAQAEKLLQKELDQYRDKAEFKLALRMIDSAKVLGNGNLSITCQPSKLGYLLMM